MDDPQLQLFAFEPPEPSEAQPSPVEDRIDALAETLGDQLGGVAVRLTLTDNRSSILHARPRRNDDGYDLRLHWAFLEAPDDVLAAAVRLTLGDTDSAGLARKVLRRWFATVRQEGDRPPRELRPFVTARTRQMVVEVPFAAALGEVYDLTEIRDEVNRRYFGGRLDVAIAWSDVPSAPRRHKKRGRRRATLKLGSWVETDRLVRLHPVLDDESVPRYVVASVVHHEMLHAELGVETRNGRRRVHPPEFRRREREFEDHVRAKGWIEKNLGRLLRRRDRLRGG